MSSWERARYIPWDRIPQSGTNLEAEKERIFRELQRETIEDELMQQERRAVEPHVVHNNQEEAQDVVAGAGGNAVGSSQNRTDDGRSSSALLKSKIPYSNMELLRQAAFGGCIGTITGGVFGFMDGMRTAGESSVLQKASNMAKTRYLIQGTTRSATLFGVFFGGFHVVKYGLRVTVDPGEIAEIGLAGAVSMSALMYKPTYRPSMPYAAMLIVMDGIQLFMHRS